MTIGRYEYEETNLAMNERTGARFINAAKKIYIYLLNLEAAKKIKLDPKFKTLVPIIDDLNSLWADYEKDRAVFKLTDELRGNYEFAKQRYFNMRRSPTGFNEAEEKKRQKLEQEKKALDIEIPKDVEKFSSDEDAMRISIKSEKKDLLAELAVLQYRKSTYEARVKRGESRCLPCGRTDNKKLEDINARIEKINYRVKELERQKLELLNGKREQLKRLHKRRWEINRELNMFEQSAMNRVQRWKNAIDNAEIVMQVRRMEIDAAIDRHYASFNKMLIHSFLIVYEGLMRRINDIGVLAQDISADMKEFTTLAEIIHCPEIADRSVDTLFKKLDLLQKDDKDQVIGLKPTPNRLPIALERTFSVKNFQHDVKSLGLHRKVLAQPEVEAAQTEMNSGAKVTFKF